DELDARLFCVVQPEDGVRDLIVTGVQPCVRPVLVGAADGDHDHRLTPAVAVVAVSVSGAHHTAALAAGATAYLDKDGRPDTLLEIGRASCRESVKPTVAIPQ